MNTTSQLAPAPALEHLGFEIGRDGAVTVHVKRPGEMFGLTLERALFRIDEFKAPDQARILRALPDYYDIPAGDAPNFGHAVRVLAQSLIDALVLRPGRKSSGRTAPRQVKKSKPTTTESV
jgi:hypothetical protein